jgi:hypothetical protein
LLVETVPELGAEVDQDAQFAVRRALVDPTADAARTSSRALRLVGTAPQSAIA